MAPPTRGPTLTIEGYRTGGRRIRVLASPIDDGTVTHSERYRRNVKSRDNGVVPIVPRGLVDQSRIKAGVERAKRALRPDVVRVMYGFTLDWTDEESLFFRIIISDAAAAPNRLRETTQRITSKILTEIKADDLGLQTYFNFRSQSEQAKLKEPTWEP